MSLRRRALRRARCSWYAAFFSLPASYALSSSSSSRRSVSFVVPAFLPEEGGGLLRVPGLCRPRAARRLRVWYLEPPRPTRTRSPISRATSQSGPELGELDWGVVLTWAGRPSSCAPTLSFAFSVLA